MNELVDIIGARHDLLVITGAGCSAPSGIPTYRDENASWQRSNPIQHRDFITDEASRRRYWARSFAGWPPVRDAHPNEAHRCLADLERRGIAARLVTQNVDRLHQKAGHEHVNDLHGRLDEVVCLSCGALSDREAMQQRLAEANPGLAPEALEITPDGDAEVSQRAIDEIIVPACTGCGGVLKPHVVFFGGSVDRALVDDINDAVAASGAVLVVGSTLMVFSSFRFVRLAHSLGKPVIIINRGKTRADDLATLKIDSDCQSVLSRLTAALD